MTISGCANDSERDREQGVDEEERQQERFEDRTHELVVLAALALDTETNIRMALAHRGKYRRIQGAGHLGSVCLALLDVGRHGDDAFPVRPLYRRVPLDRVDLGDLPEGDLGPVRHADPHAAEVPYGSALAVRIAHEHLDLVLPDLEAQRLGAVERASDLAGQVAQGQPEGAGFRQELQLHLFLAGHVVVGDLCQAGIFPEFFLEGLDRLEELLRIVGGEVDLYRGVGASDLSPERDGFGFGDDSDLPAPFADEIGRFHIPLLAIEELDVDLGEMPAHLRGRKRAAASHVDADQGEVILHHGRGARGTFRVGLGHRLERRILDPGEHLFRPADRCARRHHDRAYEVVGVEAGEDRQLYPAAGDDPDRQYQNHRADSYGGVSPFKA